MKELIRRCVRYRVDRKKICYVGAILTIVGLVFQMFSFPYSLNVWFLTPPVTISSYVSFNGTISLNEVLSEARAEQIQLVAAAPFVSANSSTKLIQPMPDEPKRVMNPVRRKSKPTRKKKNVKVGGKSEVLPPPPPPRKTMPSRFQVEHREFFFFPPLKCNQGIQYPQFYLHMYVFRGTFGPFHQMRHLCMLRKRLSMPQWSLMILICSSLYFRMFQFSKGMFH